MDDRNAQVGWTEAQWNRVREEVLRAWQSVRVAGSLLPVYGPLPPGTQVVPSEVIKDDGRVDERSVAPLLEISLPVTLSRQQIQQEDLSSALLQFRRRATQIGQLEDWYIFNGSYPYNLPAVKPRAPQPPAEPYRPSYPFLAKIDLDSLVTGAPEPIGDHRMQQVGLVMRNPGALGLFEGSKEVQSGNPLSPWTVKSDQLDYKALIEETVNAISKLEQHGYVAPYACVFGRTLFAAAHQPIGSSVALPRDRLEPLIGRDLLHSSAIDIAPEGYGAKEVEGWPGRGVLLALTGEAIDLAIAAQATPEFRYVDAQGRYVFAVFERFSLRIKDPRAIVPLIFTERALGKPEGRRDAERAEQDAGMPLHRTLQGEQVPPEGEQVPPEHEGVPPEDEEVLEQDRRDG